ncbi:MAG: ComEC family competence protein [candidate division WS2 bacterium ADurb.Bin280]|uniref:ComEC family competence protein n=1 Tax=candidate division WS2 bacterium ADurb.Bin280 TaxID=1852829 RepID=A0A1V5SCF5_9BACT|nr:MAG: ComEC family competence protein [candidate division WS2 bacterium ADurb.Bin280]
MKKAHEKIFSFSLLAGIVFTVLIWVFALSLIEADRQNSPYAVFLDVGQGDSALISLPQSIQILIDTGESASVLSKIEKNMPRFDRRIEYLVLTHADSDHIGAADDILQSFEVGEVIVGPSKSDTQVYKKIEALISENKIQKREVFSGDVICPIESACMDFLSPDRGGSYGSTNEQSLVFRFNFLDKKIMFTGDAEDEIQAKISNKYDSERLKSEVLKVAHHGSKAAIDEGFLGEVGPSQAIISVGANSYGHPSANIIEVLKNNTIEVLRTDQRGDIKMELW